MPARCLRCGQEWARDPALEVPCPVCHAGVGQPCRRPSGHEAPDVHRDRDQLALEQGFIQPCPGRSGNRVVPASAPITPATPTPTAPGQLTLFPLPAG